MAEIRMEKKTAGGMAWLWILMAILLVVLLAWFLWPNDEVEDIGTATPSTGMTAGQAPTTADTAATTTLAAVVENPQQWVGREYSGTVTVADVPTDRGFWIEQDGARLFAIVDDGPSEVPIDINPGQTLRVRGTVRNPAYLPQVRGEPPTADTSNIVDNQEAYLVVDETAIEILESGQAQ